MAIHHSTKVKAEKLGIMLTENVSEFRLDPPGNGGYPLGTVQAFWGKHNVYAFGVGAKPAMEQMEAIIALKDKHPTCRIFNEPTDPFLIKVWNDDRTLVLDREAMLPVDALIVANEGKPWKPTEVPLDGGEAHKAGFPITDNPYDEPEEGEEDDTGKMSRYTLWDEAWEASADEADAAEAEDDKDVGGSVVKSEYRIRYAEAGHPNHCGDWLAETLNSLILGKTQTDLEKFEELCALNGVDTTKYKREGTGWQGRIRMTGRNLLAKRVFEADGVLLLPPSVRPEPSVEQLVAPGDWMSAQRFKGKKPAPVVADSAGDNPDTAEATQLGAADGEAGE